MIKNKKRLETTAIVPINKYTKIRPIKIVEILKVQSRVSPLYNRLAKNTNAKKEIKNDSS